MILFVCVLICVCTLMPMSVHVCVCNKYSHVIHCVNSSYASYAKSEAIRVYVAHMMSSRRTADGVQRFLIERDSNYYIFGGRQFSRSVLLII